MSEVNKIANYNQMMSWLTRPATPKTQFASAETDALKEEFNEKLGPGVIKTLDELPPVQDPFKNFEDRNPRETAAEGGRMKFYKGMSAKKTPQNIKLETPKILEPIGYKKDGTPKYDTKSIRELDPNYLGKFPKGKELDKVKKVFQSGTPGSIIDDAVEIRNVIVLNKGNISSVEDLGNLVDFKSGNKVDTKRVKAALAIAKDNFSEIGNFKFIPNRYKGIRSKEVRGLDMVVDAIKASQNSVPDEKLIHFLPDNMGFFYKAPGEATDMGRLLKKNEKPVKGNITGKKKVYSANVYSDMYNLNKDQIKYITDRITEETGKSFTSKDYSNLVNEVKDFRGGIGQASRVAKVNAKTYKEIVDLADDDIIQNLLKGDLNRNTQTELLDRATKLVDGDISTASRRLFQMAEAMSDTTDQYKNLGVELNNNKASKIIATGRNLGGTSNRYAMSGVVYDYYGNVVDKALGATEGESFIGKYQTQIKNLLDKGQSPDEIFSLTASARRGLSPYAIFTQNLKTQVNSAIKGAYIDGALSRTHKKLQNIFKGRKYNQLNAKDKKAVNDLVETFEKTKVNALNQPTNPTAVKNGAKPIYLTAAEKKNIQLPEFDLKNAPSKSISDYKNFDKNLQSAFDKSYDTVGYSMKVPKEYLTQKNFLENISKKTNVPMGEVEKDLTNVQKVFRKMKGQMNSGMDPKLLIEYLGAEVKDLAAFGSKYGGDALSKVSKGVTGIDLPIFQTLFASTYDIEQDSPVWLTVPLAFTDEVSNMFNLYNKSEGRFGLGKAKDFGKFVASSFVPRVMRSPLFKAASKVGKAGSFAAPVLELGKQAYLSEKRKGMLPDIARQFDIPIEEAKRGYDNFVRQSQIRGMQSMVDDTEIPEMSQQGEDNLNSLINSFKQLGSYAGVSEDPYAEKESIYTRGKENPMSLDRALYPNRQNFADGPEDPSKKGLGSLNKRQFLKILSLIPAGILAIRGGPNLLKKSKKAVELVKRGADGVPDFINDLIAKVKLKAVEKGTKYFTGNRSDEFADVYQADDFVVTEQGNKITIRKRNEQGEMIEKDMEIELEKDPETGGISYKEATARPDGEGKLKDVDEYIDDIDLEDMRRYTYDE